jgi:hypothetical protein
MAIKYSLGSKKPDSKKIKEQSACYLCCYPKSTKLLCWLALINLPLGPKSDKIFKESRSYDLSATSPFRKLFLGEPYY